MFLLTFYCTRSLQSYRYSKSIHFYKYLCTLLGNNQRSGTHTGTNAHGGDTDLLARALKLREQGGKLSSTSGSKRVANGDGTTSGVDLVLVNSAVLDGEQSLRGESLVDLENVNVVDGQTKVLKDGRDGVSGANSHKLRGNTDGLAVNELGKDGLAKLLGDGSSHEEDGTGTIRDLRGVTGVGGSLGGESGLELAELLGGDTGSDSVILVDSDLLLVVIIIEDGGLDGENLLVELTGGLGSGSLLVRLGGEGILGLSGNVVLGGNVLGGDTHGDQALLGLLVVLELVGEGSDRVGSVLVGHGLNTATNTDVDLAGSDLVGNIVDSHQTGRALSVESDKGDGLGDTGNEAGGSVLSGTGTGSEDVTADNITDELGVDLGLLEQAGEESGEQLGRRGVLEQTLTSLGVGGSVGGGDDNVVGVLGGDGIEALGGVLLELGGEVVKSVHFVCVLGDWKEEQGGFIYSGDR